MRCLSSSNNKPEIDYLYWNKQREFSLLYNLTLLALVRLNLLTNVDANQLSAIILF